MRVGFLSYRNQKMAAIRAWLLRRHVSNRSYLFAFAALCLAGLTLIAIFGIIIGRRQRSLVEYVIVGTDSHTSVLRLNRSQISVRRIELFPGTCLNCGENSQADSGIRPIIGVFLVQEDIEIHNNDFVKDPLEIHGSVHEDSALKGPLEIQGSVHEDNGIKGPLEIHGSVHEDNAVKGPFEIQGSFHEDNAVKGPLEIHEQIHKDDAFRNFFGAKERSAETQEEEENVETFIDCDPSFDYAVYVVVRSEGAGSKGAMPSKDGIIQVATPWMDRLLRRTTEECRRQRRVNITVWLTTISSQVNLVNALNDVLIEAYFDNVTWYDLLIWSDPAQRSHVPLTKWEEEEEPTEVLARTRNVGVVTSGGSRRLFVHRRHYEIFGHFFPPTTDWTLDTAVRYLLRLYSPMWSSYQRTGLDDLTEGSNKTSHVGSKADVVIGNSGGHDGNMPDAVNDRKDDDLAEIMSIDSPVLQR